MQAFVAIVAAVVVSWVVLLGLLWLVRPRAVDFGEAKRFVPDLIACLRGLRRDPAVGKRVQWRLALLLVYLAIPLDVVPDFIPVLGYADDVIIVALALRSVVRSAGVEAVTRHWRGSESGRAVVLRLAGIGG